MEDSKPSETAIKTVRFLVMSDTHNLQLTDNQRLPFRLPFPEIDVILHCGDLTNNGTVEELEYAIKMIGSIKAELRLVIAGNHDMALDKDIWLKKGGSEEDHDDALEAMTGDFAKQHGVTYLAEGSYQFRLNDGAMFTVYASPATPYWARSAFQYPTYHDRWNPPESTPKHARNKSTENSIIPFVDIVMTHGPPLNVLDLAPRASGPSENSGCEHLRRAIHRVQPRLHCFGHIHQAYGAQRVDWDEQEDGKDFQQLIPQEYVGKNQARKNGYSSLSPANAEAYKSRNQTLFVNAAIDYYEGKPYHAPWLVELDFPCKKSEENSKV